MKLVPVEELLPHPKNPRRGDIPVIAESIRENGFYGAVMVQLSSSRILAGEHRWRALQELYAAGETVRLVNANDEGELEYEELPRGQIPALYLDVDDETALRILLVDNRGADVAGYDEAALAEILGGMDALEGTGYSVDDLEDLLAGMDQVPTTPEEPFRGGWADQVGQPAGAEGEAGSGKAHEKGEPMRQGPGSRGPMKEVLLYLQPADHAQFVVAMDRLKEAWETTGMAPTVLRAMIESAERLDG